MRSIQGSARKIKVATYYSLGEWGMPIIVILVALSAFGLGRISAFEELKTSLAIRNARIIDGLPAMVPGGQFVAAKGGSEYFFPWCSGGEKLLETEKIWFVSENAAQKAGLVPAKNCRGL